MTICKLTHNGNASKSGKGAGRRGKAAAAPAVSKDTKKLASSRLRLAVLVAGLLAVIAVAVWFGVQGGGDAAQRLLQHRLRVVERQHAPVRAALEQPPRHQPRAARHVDDDAGAPSSFPPPEEAAAPQS
mgnify:CR=1 FL=1